MIGIQVFSRNHFSPQSQFQSLKVVTCSQAWPIKVTVILHDPCCANEHQLGTSTGPLGKEEYSSHIGDKAGRIWTWHYSCPSSPPLEESLPENEANIVLVFLLRLVMPFMAFFLPNIRLLVSLKLHTTRRTSDGDTATADTAFIQEVSAVPHPYLDSWYPGWDPITSPITEKYLLLSTFQHCPCPCPRPASPFFMSQKGHLSS